MERVHDDLSIYCYQQLSEKIQHLYINYYFSESSVKKIKQNIDSTFSNKLSLPLMDKYNNKMKLFSGNLDARKINELISKYGIGALTCENKKYLVLIKNKRNKLAHGEEMFKDSCRGFTTRELALYGKAVDDSMSELIDLTEAFLVNKIYLKKT